MNLQLILTAGDYTDNNGIEICEEIINLATVLDLICTQ